MNYQPFSALEVGATFYDLDHSDLLMLKLSVDRTAVVLKSQWVGRELVPRGTVRSYSPNVCVNALEDGEPLALPRLRLDPPTSADPNRTFWVEGGTRAAGERHRKDIRLFAGLFLYSGMGMGTYYAKADNEAVWCRADDAAEKAEAEGVPFVYWDVTKWTDDPLLKRERAEARARFEARQTARQAAMTETTS